MSKNKSDYVSALERFSGNASAPAPSGDVVALADQSWIDRGHEDGTAEEDWFEAEPVLGAVNA
jgi:hypothetical protein